MPFINQLLWEFYAVGYDALTISIPHEEMRAQVTKFISEEDKTILDAGCGTGTLLLGLSKKYPDTNYIGIDFSAVMISIARVKKFFSNKRNIRLIHQSLSEPLPFKAESVDAIVTINTLFALDNPTKTVKAFSSILKPGAKFIIVTPAPEYSYGVIAKNHFRKLMSDNNIFTILFALLVYILLIPLYLIVFVSNFFITLKEEKGAYTKYDIEKIKQLLHTSHFLIKDVDHTMSDQEWLIYATKE